MMSFLLGLLNLIPGVETLVSSWMTAHYNAQVQLYQAKTGATVEVAQAAIAGQTAVQSKWWFVAVLIPLFALPFVVYTAKVVVWDIVLGWGTTDPINGTVGWVYITVVSSIFVHGVVDTAMSAIKQK